MTGTSIEEQIAARAKEAPQRPALTTAATTGSTWLTYGELWARVLSAAAWFESHGAKRGDRIVLAADKTTDFFIHYFGAHMAGLIAVPVDPDTNALRLSRIMSVAEPKLVMGSLRHAEGLTCIPYPATSEAVCGDTERPFPKPGDVADLMFTTGTTGAPKGVALTFGNEAAAAESINLFTRLEPRHCELLALPASHSFGLGRVRCVLSKGASMVLLPSGFASMKKFFGALDNYGITGFAMVPAGWAYISRMSGDRLDEYRSTLEYIEMGSAPLPEAEKRKLIALLPSTRICMHYGLTEASRSAFMCFSETPSEKLASAGRRAPGVALHIINEQGEPAAMGEDGEVCVAGAHVCSGYWGVPSETFDAEFAGPYFKTGDWGHLDSDGYLWLVSRKKEIINVGGKKVSPQEVEEAIEALPAISEAACVAVADEMMGEAVKAYAVAAQGHESLSTDELRQALSGRLEAYKLPITLEYVASLPRTSSGKLQRLMLK